MSEPSFPSVIKCPTCGRTQGTLSSGKSFDCMFCGAHIDMNRLGETPRSTLPANPSLTRPPGAAPASSQPAKYPSAAEHPASPPASQSPKYPTVAQPPTSPPAGQPPKYPTVAQPPASPPRPIQPPQPSTWAPLERGGQNLGPLSSPPLPSNRRLPDTDGIPTGALPLPGVSYTTSSGGAFDPGNTLLLTYRWYQPSVILEMLGPVFYMAFILFVFSLDDWGGGDEFNWLSLIVFGLLLLNSLVVVYRGLARLLNTTTLRLKDEQVFASHRPVPWAGAQVNVNDIDRLDVVARVSSGKRSQSKGFDLVAMRQDGRKVTLIPGMRQRAEAEQVAAELTSRLGLRR